MNSDSKLLYKLFCKSGFIRIKRGLKRFINIRMIRIKDAKRNLHIRAQINKISERILPNIMGDRMLIVSLTSHGNRVANFAPYAIWSILRQTKLPDKLVLNLNREKWNETNIPRIYLKLKKAGIDINYCDDVGPLTKLLPTMEYYSNAVIITIDDDIIYESNTIEQLWEAYQSSNNRSVICRSGRYIARDHLGRTLPYSMWKSTEKPLQECKISPYGVSGVLYPPHIFSTEINNVSVYEELCPKADDIWLTVMEMIDCIPVICTSFSHWNGECVSRKNEWFANGSDALHFTNDEGGMNDKQLKQLLLHYNLS